MLKAHDKEKEKESTEKDAMKASIIEEFQSIVSSQMGEQNGKRLRAAGAKVAVVTSSTDGDAAERCASALMEKFSSMGSKAPSKSG